MARTSFRKEYIKVVSVKTRGCKIRQNNLLFPNYPEPSFEVLNTVHKTTPQELALNQFYAAMQTLGTSINQKLHDSLKLSAEDYIHYWFDGIDVVNLNYDVKANENFNALFDAINRRVSIEQNFNESSLFNTLCDKTVIHKKARIFRHTMVLLDGLYIWNYAPFFLYNAKDFYSITLNDIEGWEKSIQEGTMTNPYSIAFTSADGYSSYGATLNFIDAHSSPYYMANGFIELEVSMIMPEGYKVESCCVLNPKEPDCIYMAEFIDAIGYAKEVVQPTPIISLLDEPAFTMGSKSVAVPREFLKISLQDLWEKRDSTGAFAYLVLWGILSLTHKYRLEDAQTEGIVPRQAVYTNDKLRTFYHGLNMTPSLVAVKQRI